MFQIEAELEVKIGELADFHDGRELISVNHLETLIKARQKKKLFETHLVTFGRLGLNMMSLPALDRRWATGRWNKSEMVIFYIMHRFQRTR